MLHQHIFHIKQTLMITIVYKLYVKYPKPGKLDNSYVILELKASNLTMKVRNYAT